MDRKTEDRLASVEYLVGEHRATIKDALLVLLAELKKAGIVIDDKRMWRTLLNTKED